VDEIYIDAGYFTHAANDNMTDDSPLKKPDQDGMPAFEEKRYYD
jgi:hypothetical protein